MRSTRRSGRPDCGRPPLETVYLGGGTPSLLPPDDVARLLDRVRERFGARRRRRGHARGQPRARRARRPGGAARGRRHAASRSAPSRSTTRSCASSAGAIGPATSPTPSPRRARPASARSTSTCCTTSPDATVADWMRDARRGARARARPPVALRADARRPRRRGLTGPDGDHLPTTPGARRWRDAARPARTRTVPRPQYHHAVDRLAEDGWHGLRDQQLGAAGPREPPQPRLLGAPAVRGRRAGRARLRWRDPALERGPPRRLRRRARAAGRARREPAAGRLGDDSTMPPRPPRRSSSACGPTAACRSPRPHEPPLADVFGWALAAELLTVTDGDRVVLTTRGRLLSNELFARLV